jgi:hypothetical protein
MDDRTARDISKSFIIGWVMSGIPNPKFQTYPPLSEQLSMIIISLKVEFLELEFIWVLSFVI